MRKISPLSVGAILVYLVIYLMIVEHYWSTWSTFEAFNPQTPCLPALPQSMGFIVGKRKATRIWHILYSNIYEATIYRCFFGIPPTKCGNISGKSRSHIIVAGTCLEARQRHPASSFASNRYTHPRWCLCLRAPYWASVCPPLFDYCASRKIKKSPEGEVF